MGRYCEAKMINVKLRSKVIRLSESQKGVFDCLLSGWTNKEIGNELGMNEKTVKFHMTNIFKTAGVSSRSQLMAEAMVQIPQGPEEGLVIGAVSGLASVG